MFSSFRREIQVVSDGFWGRFQFKILPLAGSVTDNGRPRIWLPMFWCQTITRVYCDEQCLLERQRRARARFYDWVNLCCLNLGVFAIWLYPKFHPNPQITVYAMKNMMINHGILGHFQTKPILKHRSPEPRFAIREKRLYFFDIEVKEVSGVPGQKIRHLLAKKPWELHFLGV